MSVEHNDPDRTSPPVGLGRTAARGMAWMTGETIIAKAATLLGTLVLAAFLLSEDEFGLYASALTVSAFAALIEQAGLRDVLIFRHAKFRRWANAAFWMSMAAGCASMLFIILAAPLATPVYGEPAVFGLLLVLAVAAPINTLSIVPRASLLGQLRFRYIAATELVVGIGLTGMTVLLAWAEFGAYSFVLPKPIMYAFRATAFFIAARPRIHLNPQIKRWKYLFSDSAFVLSTAGLTQAVLQGDRILLGAFFGMGGLGLYFIAHQLSRQVSAMFSLKLNMIFLPSLSKLQDDSARQVNAFLRGVKMLAYVTVPACFAIAAVAEPLSTLINMPDMATMMQILAVGGAFHSVGTTVGSLLRAQGRFRVELALAGVRTVLFFILISLGAWLWGVIGVAIASSVHTAVACGIGFAVATRPGGGTAMTVWRILAFPVLASAVAAAVGALVGSYLPSGPAGDVVSIVVIAAVTALVYLIACWWLARPAVFDLLTTARSILPDHFVRRLSTAS